MTTRFFAESAHCGIRTISDLDTIKIFAREYREAVEYHAQMEYMAERSEDYEDAEDFAYRLMWNAFVTYTDAIAEWCGMSRKAARKLVNEKPMAVANAIDALHC